ncbi:MAG: DUF1772 domain-containing protein [Siphonobacter aquaeclarae]|nr:DUF1772 domain-containing protein [Siphonobacter aquaeclarae]
MSNLVSTLVLGLTILASGLIAGLFYAWSCAVSPGLNRVPDAAYLATMQQINRAILNPAFFATFMGTLILLPLSCWLFRGNPVPFWLLLAATILYAVGVFGVTMRKNVPLNDQLDKTGLTGASPTELREYRDRFEEPWNRWNDVRTSISAAVFGLAVIAALVGSVRE